jgi:succinate-semialdehyde dehydrogenase/glutarate-semialdehyde dehydrogenase
MATALTDVRVHLSDASLLREQCYINGEWVDADSGETIEVTDPSNGEVIGTIPKMGAAETKRAIEGAHEAFKSWKRTTAKHRAGILRRWFDLRMENQEDLAILMTREQGVRTSKRRLGGSCTAKLRPSRARSELRADNDLHSRIP